MKICPNRICYHPDRASGHTIGGRRDVWHHTFHPDNIRNSALPTFHPDVSHPEFCAADIPPGCLTSGILRCWNSIRIFCIRRLTPDGRGGSFNFPGQTYSDLLIELTRRVLQPILHSATVFSWSFQIFATDILRYFALDIWCLDWHFEIFCFRYLMSKSPNSPCNPPMIGFLSY